MKTQLRTLACLALFALALLALGVPAQAQPPLDTTDLEGFLSLGAVTGQPTLIVKPESRDIALAQMRAQPLDADRFYTDVLGQQIIFGILVTPAPASFLPVADETNPDILTVTYSNRACERQATGSTSRCVHQSDGTYLMVTNVSVDRCTKGGIGKCTELRVVSVNSHYFYDDKCKLEIPNTYKQKTGLRCPL